VAPALHSLTLLDMGKHPDDMVDEEIRARIVNLAFDGDEVLFRAFREKLRLGLPEGTTV
jgi:hypothetical protein